MFLAATALPHSKCDIIVFKCVCTCLFMLDNPCTNFKLLRTFPKWNNSHCARLLWLNISPLNNQLYAIQLLISPVLLFSLCWWSWPGWGVGWPGFSGRRSHHRLMNWLHHCCQWVCALGEGAPVTGGNPSYGTRHGAAIMSGLQGAIGADNPGSSPDPHTAVTPLETHTVRAGGEVCGICHKIRGWGTGHLAKQTDFPSYF